MQITPYSKYYNRFVVSVTTPPDEIPLNEWEKPGEVSIGIDDQDGTYLAVNYSDDLKEDEQWSAKKGVAGRWTFVVVKRGAETIGAVGYEFPGLISLDNLRTWYRETNGIKDAEPAAEPA